MTRRCVASGPRWLAVSLAAAGAAWAQPATIRWLPSSVPAAVEVSGLTAETRADVAGLEATNPDWTRWLAVYAEQDAAATNLPAMQGTWRIREGRLWFETPFPFSRGVRYRAEFRPAAGAPPVVSYFELPPDTTPATTTVTQVFPSEVELPENQLKFYVQFSAPMSRGEAYHHIRLRDAAGHVVELAFLELDEELWDPGMTRLTLLIDPGRIKRGVRPLEESGPVFEAGRAYALEIDAALRDAAGRPLRAGFSKPIRVRAADRTPPDPARWKVTAPAAGTRDPLVVDFDEPLDQALALRLITVATGPAEVESLAGEPALAAGERRWSFVPRQPWRAGPHHLVVATTIEDLAGNNVGKAFDVDVFERVNRRLATDRVTVPFAVR